MNVNNATVLKEFCKIALDVEKARRVHKDCECCKRNFSTYLYVIKTLIYGIYHVCGFCKIQLEITPAEGSTTFVSKFPQ
jgi:hypothetical protein